MMRDPRSAPAQNSVTLAADVALDCGRAHEIVGRARQALALMVAARLQGPVLWLGPFWADERPMGDGVAALLEPRRMIFGRARTGPEILWAAEEALRSGVVPLVVAETPAPPGLTPVRRLHLAAEAGAARGTAPLALLLLPGDGGAAGVETRWRADPAPGWARDGRPRWRLARLRARMAPPAAWEARLAPGGLALAPLPQATPA
jgi:protein ImuA